MSHVDIRFTDKNSERFMLARRVYKVIEDLENEYLYPDSETLGGFKFRDGQYKFSQIDEGEWTDFDSENDYWGYKEDYAWFRHSFTVPERFAGRPVVYQLAPSASGPWNRSNPQFIMYFNGELRQGGDSNHSEIRLLDCAKGGEEFDCCLNAYSDAWEFKGKLRMGARLKVVDDLVNRLIFDLKTPLKVASLYDADDLPRIDIVNALNDAVNLIDFNTADYDTFAASAEAAIDLLDREIYSKDAMDATACCIGHTHIDVAWLWRLRQTREKAGRSFATVLKLMEEYPEYKFMSSQAQLYAFVKEDYPEVYEGIKKMIAAGRWEVEGSMWVESDTNVTSGESLVRQFLVGKRFFKEEFGVDNRILWLPDVFGYSGALPQIMAKCGIDYFMTTKLAWNQFNKMPYDTFKWRGIDGTEILTHLVTTLGVGQSENDFFTTYNGILHPDALIGGWHRYQQKDINNDILISYGYGDGGGGPTRAMLETSTRMEKGIEGLPKVRQAFARTYFDELAERVKDNRRLPTWEGELYFEYHRGTYTSMARNKRSNRKIELHMMDLELLSLLAQAKVAYPEAEIDKLWHGILINQFHDILPGSSIHEVYEVTKKEYAEMEAEITALREERLDALTPAGEGVTVYNTTGFVRSDVVELGDCKAEALQDEAGNIYPVQKTADGAVAFLNNLPAKGSKTFAVVPAQVSAAPFEIAADGHKIDTPFYTVTFDEHGQMTGIFDKENRREVLKPGQAGNLFRVYEDKPIYYDNWDIDIFYTEKFWDVTDLQDFTWTENGPVRATLHIERNYSNSTLVQDIHFYAKQRRIEFVTTVDWHEHQSLLKVHFPVNVHTDEATFEIQYGNLTRKTHANTSWDRARFESCGQKWMDLSEGHYGVSMLNDCKYGHSVKDSVIGLTLIKSGIEPNPTTDQEVHHFTYAIYPHAEKWQAAGTVPQAFFLNQPALAVQGGKPGESFSLAGLDAPNVVLETIKRAEDGDGAIVRMYECENSLTNVTLDWNLPFHAAESCNCLEQPDGEPVEVKDGKITFTVKPYEIKTIRIR